MKNTASTAAPILCGALALVLLASCGGGGSGASSSPPSVTGTGVAPSSGPGDASNYFPFAENDSWTYDESNVANPSALAQLGYAVVTVVEPAIVDGQNVMAASDADTVSGQTIVDYYLSSGGGLTYFGDNDHSDLVTAGTTPYVEMLYPVQPGTASTVTAHDIAFGTASNGDPLTTSFTQVTGVADVETVTVTAGNFPNSAKIVQSVSGTLTDTVSGQTISYSGALTTWMAPGIGIVKQLNTANINGTASSNVQTARQYTINLVTHGVSEPYTVDSSAGTAPVYEAVDIALAASPDAALVIEQYAESTEVPCQLSAVLADLLGNPIAKTSLGSSCGGGAAAFDGTNFETALVELSGGVTSLTIQLISTAGQLRSSYPLASGVISQLNVAIANGADNLIVGFFGNDGANSCVCAEFVLPSGSASSVGLVEVATYTNYGGPAPTIATAFDGTNYLVVWSTAAANGSAPIYAARVSPAGTVLDTTPLLVSNSAPALAATVYPKVAFDGTNYLVVWQDARNAGGGPNRDIYGARVSTAGALLDGPASTGGVQLSSPDAAMPRGTPDVAFNGTEYIVAWEANGYTIAGVRATPSMAITSGEGFELNFGAAYAANANALASGYLNPAVAAVSGANQVAVYWRAESGSDTEYSLQGVTVSPF